MLFLQHQRLQGWFKVLLGWARSSIVAQQGSGPGSRQLSEAICPWDSLPNEKVVKQDGGVGRWCLDQVGGKHWSRNPVGSEDWSHVAKGSGDINISRIRMERVKAAMKIIVLDWNLITDVNSWFTQVQNLTLTGEFPYSFLHEFCFHSGCGLMWQIGPGSGGNTEDVRCRGEVRGFEGEEGEGHSHLACWADTMCPEGRMYFRFSGCLKTAPSLLSRTPSLGVKASTLLTPMPSVAFLPPFPTEVVCEDRWALLLPFSHLKILEESIVTPVWGCWKWEPSSDGGVGQPLRIIPTPSPPQHETLGFATPWNNEGSNLKLLFLSSGSSNDNHLRLISCHCWRIYLQILTQFKEEGKENMNFS